MIKWFLKYINIIALVFASVVAIAYLVSVFVVVDETTLVATLSFWNTQEELSPELWNTIQALAALPLMSIFIIILNMINMNIKLSQQKSVTFNNIRSQDNFNATVSQGMKLQMLYLQHQVKHDMFLDDEAKTYFKVNANGVIDQLNAYEINKTDLTNLSPQEQLLIKNKELDYWNQAKSFLERIDPSNPRLLSIATSVELISKEIKDLTGLIFPQETV